MAATAEHRRCAAARRHGGLPFGIALALGLLGGCATLPPPSADTVRSGRFAATVTIGDQRDNMAGRFMLSSNRDGSTTLDLATPLGTTMARVQTAAGRTTLTAPQSDGTLASWEGDSPDALVESVLGWSLPVSGLPDWLAGRAAAGRPARVFVVEADRQAIEQDGWLVVIEERFADTPLPRRLTLTRQVPGAGTPKVDLRLVLDPPSDAGAASNSNIR